MGRVETLAAVRDKYPQYGDMSDDELGSALAAKYPEYADLAPEKGAPAASGETPSAFQSWWQKIQKPMAGATAAVLEPVVRELTEPLVMGERVRQGESPMRVLSSAPSPRGSATPAMKLLLQVAPGLFPHPAVAGPASAAGEFLAGGSPESVGLAAAIPPGMATLGRVARATGRMTTRLVPSLFRRAQGAAQEAGEQVVGKLRPETEAGALFRSAEAGADDVVATTRTDAVLQQLERSIPKSPVDPGLRQVREHIQAIKSALQAPSGTSALTVGELNTLRLDLGHSIRKGGSPELKAMYEGLLGDLEEAASKAGGEGAAALKEALTTFKRDLGAQKVSELVAKATSKPAVGEIPALDINKLRKLVHEPKTAKQLTNQLGPEGTALIDGFIERYKTLPPTHAATAASLLLGTIGAGLGYTATGGAGLFAALAPEMVRNIWAVGRNPAQLNRFLNLLGVVTVPRPSTEGMRGE